MGEGRMGEGRMGASMASLDDVVNAADAMENMTD